jgi:putative ABC transport system permease protein
MDKNQPVESVETLTGVLAHKGAADRLLSALLGTFTALALGLATIGVYGVVSYIVTQRTHEIGLRMALGAHRGDVFRLVVGKGVFLATIGAVIGFLLAVPILRVLAWAHPADSWVHSALPLVLAPLLVIGAAVLACYIPARRAMRVDPMVALRYE